LDLFRKKARGEEPVRENDVNRENYGEVE